LKISDFIKLSETAQRSMFNVDIAINCKDVQGYTVQGSLPTSTLSTDYTTKWKTVNWMWGTMHLLN